jgi:DNA polymerase-3 subunit delta
MKDKFIKDADQDGDSLDIVDGQNVNISEINEKINTGSLFTKKRMVIINDIFKNKKTAILTELLEILKRVAADDEKIIIIHDGELGGKEASLKVDAKKLFAYLLKQKYVQEFKFLKDNGLLSFIKKEANLYDKDISTTAATEIVKRTGGDLWLVTQGIKKAALISEEKIISLELIKEMTTETFSEDIFALTDALGARNKKLALKIMEEQYLAGVSDEYLMAMLTRQFKILLQLSEAANSRLAPDKIAQELKLHPFVVKKGLAQARNFTSAQLLSYLNRLLKFDFNNKTGGSDLKTEITLLIAGI